MSALAGIDQALWDLKGKRYGLSVHQMLGGRVRDRMQVYAWVGGDEPAEVAAGAKEKQSQGYGARWLIIPPRRLPWVNAFIAGGISSASFKRVWSILFSRTFPMRVGSPKLTRSLRWPKLMIPQWLFIVRLGR